MKKIFSILLCLGFIAGTAQAQEGETSSSPVRNIIKFSPFHFVESTFLMSYERMMPSNKSSIYINAGLHSRENSFYGFGGTPQPSFGFQGEVQYRAYVAAPREKSFRDKGFFFFKGIYAGPYAYYRYRSQSSQQWDPITLTYDNSPQDISEYSGGVVMGVQFAILNKLYMDFYTGGGIKFSQGASDNGYRDVTSVGYTGVIPKIGFQIGIGF